MGVEWGCNVCQGLLPFVLYASLRRDDRKREPTSMFLYIASQHAVTRRGS